MFTCSTMVTFCFNSFGKLKLLVSRLTKLSNNVCVVLHNDECIFVHEKICIRLGFNVLDGVIDTYGEQFKIDMISFHNVLKNIPSTRTCHFTWDHQKILQLHTKNTLSKKKYTQSICNKSTCTTSRQS